MIFWQKYYCVISIAEKKDHELNELRRRIDMFKQCGIDAGLISGSENLIHQNSMGSTDLVSDSEGEGGTSNSSSKSKKSSGGPKRSGWLRNSFSKAFNKK